MAVLLQDPNLDLFFSDKTGIEGDPKPRQRWAKKEVKPQMPYIGDHIHENIIGAVSYCAT